ncbi:MAG TPA: PHB depolymerase family esterase [Ktedonobacteraceae bacterium]
MYNRDIHHLREFRLRRLAAWVCLAFSLLIITGVVIYSLQAGIIPGFSNGQTELPAVPGFSQNTNAPCSTARSVGDSTIYISSNRIKRNFILRLPPTYGQQPLPLVINYHGYDSSAAKFESYTNMSVEADKAGFIVVFPQGALDNNVPQPKPSWNAGIGAGGPTGLTDDVQFTRDMLSYLQRNYCVDTHRIYVAGYSIGGSMAYRIACTLSKQIAAFATVEGAFYHIPPNGCQATRPIPLLEIHSLVDRFAPYNGDTAKKLIGVPDFLNLWFAINQCNANANQTIFKKADVTAYKWSQCANGTVIEHYKITDGGHVWAGSPINMPSLGYTTHTIDANVVIWNFFSGFKS